MKKTLLLVIGIAFLVYSHATNVIFNGNPLSSYINQEVTFTQTLYVCGIYNHNIYLSYERLRQAEEVAITGTAAYDSAVVHCTNGILTAYCPNISTDSIRLGSTITNFTATVTGDRAIRFNGSCLALSGNVRPTTPPAVGNARLTLCAANLEYYCPIWSGTLGASSDEEFAIQHIKTMKALANIGADIFALTEIQQGPVALDSIVNGLNALTVPGRYAYIQDNDEEISTYTKVGFVYRTDKVRPVLTLGNPYGPGAYASQSVYFYREYVQAFEEIATNERFVLSMNHFKSKSGGTASDNYCNADRMENAQYLTDFLSQELANNFYHDSDILIVGDLNCSTMEEPIRYLESQGYENMLTQYAPDEYSYVFDDQVEYLDHVLASASMSGQITGAQPYHLNADEPYAHYYPYGDTSMYRYSDHDPIIIGLNLSSTPNTDCEEIEVSESFAQSFGCFSTQNCTGDNFWYINSSYDCAYINGYYSGNNEDWLVSPSFDLSDKENAIVEFTHTLGYGSNSTWGQNCQLMISTDYAGDVLTANWNQLSISNMPSSNWTWCANSIEIPAPYMNAQNVTLAFHYNVVTGDIPAWEIKDFSFTASCRELQDDTLGIADHLPEIADFKAFGCNGTLVFQSEEPTQLMIVDMLGRVLFNEKGLTEHRQALPAGIYIVRTSSGSRKVVVSK